MYFWICKKYALIVLKNRWKNNLNLLLKGTLSELKEIIKGKLGENKLGIISSWNDYFIKVSIISKNISEAENLTSILIQHGVISFDGELNWEKIFLKKEEISNTKIK